MENTDISNKKRDNYLNIIVVESVCVLIILLSVFVTKLLFKNVYQSVEDWYNKNICVDTDINQVAEEGNFDAV